MNNISDYESRCQISVLVHTDAFPTQILLSASKPIHPHGTNALTLKGSSSQCPHAASAAAHTRQGENSLLPQESTNLGKSTFCKSQPFKLEIGWKYSYLCVGSTWYCWKFLSRTAFYWMTQLYQFTNIPQEPKDLDDILTRFTLRERHEKIHLHH